MRNKLIIFCVGICCITGFAFGGNLNPSAAPTAGTMKTLDQVEPRIPIESLPGFNSGTSIYKYRITTPGSYYLNGNIDINTMMGGIIVHSDDVTIDLNGYTIRGVMTVPSGSNETAGIFVGAYRNVVIKNGIIDGPSDTQTSYQGFGYGIKLYGSQSLYSQSISVESVVISSQRFGVYSTACKNLSIKNCKVRTKELSGFSLNFCNGLLENCMATAGSYGFYMSLCDMVNVKNSQAFRSGNVGFILSSSGVVLDGCGSSYNGGDGFSGDNMSIFKINNCVASFNGSHGIVSTPINATPAFVTNSIVSNNNKNGIYLASGGLVTGNSSYSNNQLGLSYADYRLYGSVRPTNWSDWNF